MVADLERRRIRIAVRLEGGFRPEDNRSLEPGSDLLDDDLRREFEPLAHIGDYTVLRRIVTR